VENGTAVVIIQHAHERKSQSNTGSMLAWILRNSSLHLHGGPGVPLDLSVLRQADVDCAVLFPWSGAPVVSADALGRRPGRRQCLVVLDATWSQARKMAQRIPEVRRLPFLRLSDDAAPRYRLRKPLGPGLLGTGEAVALALELLGEAGAAAAVRVGLSIVARNVLMERGKLRRDGGAARSAR